MQNIILYGMRGTGKTSIGKNLSNKLNKDFIDLDQYIEQKINDKIFNYIETNGWESFRKLEHECLKEVLETNRNIILSLGGGTIIFPNNQNLILKMNKKLIYIDSPINIIGQRIQNDENNGNKRNSLSSSSTLEELTKIYNERKETYEKFYDFKINNTDSIENATNQIQNKLKIGNICTAITNFETIEEQINTINQNKEIKYAELRIDFLNDLNKLEKICNKIQKQIILTNRTNKEGGNFNGTNEQSLEILIKYSPLVQYIDFELQNGDLINTLKTKLTKQRLIISYHNFEKTPDLESLKQILHDMQKYSPDVYKIALMPQTKEDIQTIYQLEKYFQENFEEDYIFISMGELGQETRVKIPANGGLLSFGTISEASAPGQFNFKELHKQIIS